MAEAQSDTKLMLLMVLLAAWTLVFATSTYSTLDVLAGLQPDLIKGWPSNARATLRSYLGYQLIAGLLAFAILIIGFSWPKVSGIRKVTLAPFLLTLVVVAALSALIWTGQT